MGEYTSGEIIVYDIENNFDELGRIATGETGLTGIKIGPDGSIWYTNRVQNTLTRLTPGEISATEEQTWSADVDVLPNPTTGILRIGLPPFADQTITKIQINDVTGKTVMAFDRVNDTETLNISTLPNGLYILTVFNDRFAVSKKIVLEK